jgi:nucleotide-binding universal stress UspA family protein
MSSPIFVEMRRGAAAAVDAAAAVAGAFGRAPIRVVEGGADLASLARNEDAALVVIEARGRGRIAGAMAAGRAAALSAAASRPVMVVPHDFSGRAQSPGEGGSIVIGVDGSRESLRALELAGALAGSLDLQPLPVFADKERPRPEGLGGVIVRPAGARKAINSVVAAADGRLIVVGSRGRGPVAGTLLGSVAGALAGSARVPVLVVTRQAQIDALQGLPDRASEAIRAGSS